ncbi:class I SAM-dependent methyltransferase [Haladaptatus sp. NG-SE-30]
MSDDGPLAKTDPANYYDRLAEGEWGRLEATFKNSLEFESTTDYLDQYLPASGRVLDAGGAAGRYSVWLAEQGYDVTLLDLSAEQVAIARERVAEHGLEDRVTVQQGDIRDLPKTTASTPPSVSAGRSRTSSTPTNAARRSVNSIA